MSAFIGVNLTNPASIFVESIKLLINLISLILFDSIMSIYLEIIFASSFDKFFKFNLISWIVLDIRLTGVLNSWDMFTKKSNLSLLSSKS